MLNTSKSDRYDLYWTPHSRSDNGNNNKKKKLHSYPAVDSWLPCTCKRILCKNYSNENTPRTNTGRQVLAHQNYVKDSQNKQLKDNGHLNASGLIWIVKNMCLVYNRYVALRHPYSSAPLKCADFCTKQNIDQSLLILWKMYFVTSARATKGMLSSWLIS